MQCFSDAEVWCEIPADQPSEPRARRAAEFASVHVVENGGPGGRCGGEAIIEPVGTEPNCDRRDRATHGVRPKRFV